ncbi:MAG: hypothetical protein AAF216_12845 [Pseudomonadota bacterium]
MRVFNQRAWTTAVLVALALVLAQFVFRPPWRDEYWALYFSNPNASLWPLITETMSRDVHPPAYFILLHAWRQVAEVELFARALNLVFLAFGAWGGWQMRGQRPHETALFLLLCGTSFWLVFFSAEIRMMSALFVLCALMVLAGRNWLSGHNPTVNMACWVGLGMAAASSHFFGALWTGSFGLALGLAWLLRGRFFGFVQAGVFTLVALAPALAWIAIFRPDTNPGAPSAEVVFTQALTDGLEQFLRGITVKTAFANLAATVAASFGLRAALSGWQGGETRPLLWAVGIAVAVAFGVHLFYVPLIKERAFIVVIPALLYIAAVAIRSLKPEQTRALAISKAAPIVAAISLPLFASELFKDRERYREVVAFLADRPGCAGSPILAYERPSSQAQDFAWFFTEQVLDKAFEDGDLALVRLSAGAGLPPNAGCDVRALAMNMPRGSRGADDMYAAFSDAGHPIADWQEIVLGEGRSRIFVSRESSASTN